MCILGHPKSLWGEAKLTSVMVDSRAEWFFEGKYFVEKRVKASSFYSYRLIKKKLHWPKNILLSKNP